MIGKKKTQFSRKFKTQENRRQAEGGDAAPLSQPKTMVSPSPIFRFLLEKKAAPLSSGSCPQTATRDPQGAGVAGGTNGAPFLSAHDQHLGGRLTDRGRPAVSGYVPVEFIVVLEIEEQHEFFRISDPNMDHWALMIYFMLPGTLASLVTESIRVGVSVVLPRSSR